MANENDILLKIGGGIVGLLVVSATIVFDLFVEAFILIKLWTWFVIPFLSPVMGETVPLMNYPIAIGIMVIAGFFKTPKTSETNDGDNALKMVSIAFAKWGITLLIGWIVHLFI